MVKLLKAGSDNRPWLKVRGQFDPGHWCEPCKTCTVVTFCHLCNDASTTLPCAGPLEGSVLESINFF